MFTLAELSKVALFCHKTRNCGIYVSFPTDLKKNPSNENDKKGKLSSSIIKKYAFMS